MLNNLNKFDYLELNMVFSLLNNIKLDCIQSNDFIQKILTQINR